MIYIHIDFCGKCMLAFDIVAVLKMANVIRGINAAEEEAIIKTRFITGASASRGEPPLKKLAKK